MASSLPEIGKVMLLALGVSAIYAPLAFRSLKRIGSSQNVSAHLPEHAQKQGTPTMGGIIVLVGLIVAALPIVWEGSLPALYLIAGFSLVGLLDDYVVQRFRPESRGLDWKPKLLLEIGAAVAAVVASGRTDAVSIGAALFLILLFSNAYNFADGMDGLAGGLGIFMAAGLVGLAAAGGYSPASLPVVAAVAAAMIPFLVLNYPPAKVFMGDIGALPIGAIMGWAVFEFLWQPGGFAGTGLIAGIAVWSLVMLVELIPPPLQVLWFKTKGRRLFPFKTPIHHGMQDKGMPEGRVTVTLVAAQALCSILAVAITWAVIS